ncbi:MAG: hypothetical protein Tsb006_7600 [Rickettsiaceae bacterium]
MSSRLVKMAVVTIIAAAGMTLPIQASREDLRHQEQINSTWHSFKLETIKEQLAAGRIVFVDVTADWCLSCKYNKFMVLDRDKTIKLLKENNVYALRGDLTSHNQAVYDYVVANGAYGIPFYKIYGPKKPDGIILPIIISYSDLKSAIKEVW